MEMGVKRMLSLALAVLSIIALGFSSVWSSPQTVASTMSELEAEQDKSLIRITVPNEKALDELVASDLDLTEYLNRENGKIEMDAIATNREVEDLLQQGYDIEMITSDEEVNQILTERQHTVDQLEQISEEADQLNILRANHFTNQSGTFLYIETKTTAGDYRSNVLTAEWTDENGQQQSATLSPKVDHGEYLYHYVLLNIEDIPEHVTITSSLGASAESAVTEWIGDGTPDDGKHYVTDFIDHYMDPTEITERIEQLAEEFPEIAEIVTLPYETNGYRRNAQAIIGDVNNNPGAAIVLTSHAWGHEGGNQISVELQNPEQANADLQVNVSSDTIEVNLATNSTSNPISTAAEVIEAINDEAGHLVTATPFRNNQGEGIVQAQTEITLTDGLNAPEEISRDPFEVKAIRIGKDRDGSKTGVLAYSQEHAREWVTPLVAIETAERLLRNYSTDADTKKLVNNLDIFIVPTVNPDGGHYSFYDYNYQRKNMTNHCPAESADPLNRNSWGVDLNRNHSVGSVHDGYIGGSTNCLSGSYAGPEETSEPEAKNLIWLAEENPNIKFGMNIHSYGGYFMWPPGAYDENRTTLPRPTAGEEAYFWQASETILDAIKEHRGTVILPGRTGPIPDVLYSAAGNSADVLWYEHDIFAWDFEVGADLWNPETGRWQAVGFQPPFEEGHEEAMEFANGMIGMLDIAHQYGKDHQLPKSSLQTVPDETSGTVEISFETSEPATVFYTLDGSKPTFESDRISLKGTREGAESITITETTTVKWFSMDVAGNIEKNYNPEGNGKNYNQKEVRVK
ncbi:zinc carboxypeptidase [Ornithinibacillus sp. L9]|uniref:Zinc carboxypeptidase n=2 Tax=Ornithinibacillus caprae TaxID=2678566 RepID=A0A6N8FEA6_9BACI|nr:zinc carboxypeptidase [Ornithinibacillus caprae]